MTKKKVVKAAEVVEEKTAHQTRFDVVTTEANPPSTFTPANLIQQAITSGAGLETMERLFDLQLKYEENEAKKAYFKAFAAFKAEAVDIVKDHTVDFKNQAGKRTVYDHATIGNVIKTITPYLSLHDLSLNWSTVQNGSITVTCTLTHALGFSQSTSLSAGKDSTGGKNDIQQVISTQTYLQRHTALAITGLATRDQDDDGRGSEADAEYIEVITEDQGMDLLSLLAELKISEAYFNSYYKIDHVYQLPAAKFAGAVKNLEDKRKEDV